MVKGEEDWGKLGQEGRHTTDFFYAEDGMVSSSDPQWVQSEFSTLVGLFDRVGMWTNYGKTVGIVFRLCQEAGTQSESAYRRRITGEGPSYRDRHKVRVQCRECGKEMATGSLAGHRTTQHGKAAEEIWIWKTSATGEDPQTY